MDRYDCISPLDHRYYGDLTPLVPFLSENALTKAKLMVEVTLVETHMDHGHCSSAIFEEIARASEQVTTLEVYEEEGRTHHDIRALVNCIQRKVSEEARPFVHLGATSYDINDTANIWRYKRAMRKVILPALIELERTLIALTEREAQTGQIGRTHGQWAVPITVGFATAKPTAALGDSIMEITRLTNSLVGKFSGATGSYNALDMMVDDPITFEQRLLAKLGLKPAEISTQIAPHEPLMRLFKEIVTAAGVIANLARDMRNLQRSEIGEFGEHFEADQVGSSTMPNKQNPINFENVEGVWKLLQGLQVVVSLDQISDHQRDLTGSVTGRFYPEMFAAFYAMVVRMNRTLGKIVVHPENLERNLSDASKNLGEPFYIALAELGHPDAHEAIRKLSLKVRETGKPLMQVAQEDADLAPYLARMSPGNLQKAGMPHLFYTGRAEEKATAIAQLYTNEMDELEHTLAA